MACATDNRWRRRFVWSAIGVLTLLLLVFGRPAYLVMRAWMHDKPFHESLPPRDIDDASRLNRTTVSEVWDIPGARAEAEQQLAELLARARKDGLKVSIAGARHSMGGHTIAPNGIVINMLPFDAMAVDLDTRILSVGAGARWSQIVPYLNARGLSVGVMQSNNDFSVGGSLSVNCHGWQHNRPPIASTVESMRVMKADGAIVRCSRTENAELFKRVLGGYGLFGIILDVELRVVPNERYRAEVTIVATRDYVTRFDAATKGGDVGMVYGRLCVAPGDSFLRDAIMTVFRKAPCPEVEIPPLKSSSYAGLRREIYRSQIGSAAGKAMRWSAERHLGESLGQQFVSRNQLLNEGADIYREQNAGYTDILHEYFIPNARFEAFLENARTVLLRHPQADLLNVTVRNVLEDHDTFLRYADQNMFCFVMLFHQARTPEADEEMKRLTRELIDAAHACQGRYYLPYRLHATQEQFERAYPQATDFFRQRREYDPHYLFANQFQAMYGDPK